MIDRAKLSYVEGDLNYMARMAERPRYLAYDPEPGEQRSNMTYDTHKMQIHDMRPVQHELGLDHEGFGLVEHRTAVRDFCLVQQSREQIVLEVVAGEGWATEIASAIERRFETFFEPGVHFSISVVEVCSKTKSGKRNPIISRVSK